MIANYTCGTFETFDSTLSAIGLSKWSMERYLKKLQGEKADLEKKLQGMLAGDFKPFDVTIQGKKDLSHARAYGHGAREAEGA
jgi:hypothetical protein